MRLSKYMASCGIASRRGSERIIDDGHVTVNGVRATDPAMDVDPDTDEVLVRGVPAKPSRLVYYVLNKPVGYTSSREDKHAKMLVNELVPASPPVWSVGRLDRDTSGLLIMTNDGALTQILTHPSYEKEKEYLLSTDTRFTDDQIAEARAGVPLIDGMIIPEVFEPMGGKSYRIVIHEGRNRLIRRFAAYFGKKTTKLSRTRVAGLELGDLDSGDYRIMTPAELVTLIDGIKS